MNDQYPIGTICIGQNLLNDPTYNGIECEIIGGLEMSHWVNESTGEEGVDLLYEVVWVDGTTSYQAHHELKLPPPKHKEWADEKVRKLTKQDSDHVVVQLADAIPEEA